MAEVGLQLNTSQWALTFEKSSQDFTTSRLSIDKMEQSFLSEVARNDPKAEQLHLYDLQMNNDKYCSYLAKQSRAALTRSEAAQSQLAQRLREYPSAGSRGSR